MMIKLIGLYSASGVLAMITSSKNGMSASVANAPAEPAIHAHECAKCDESFPSRYNFCPLCGDRLPMSEGWEEVGDGSQLAKNTLVLYEGTRGTVLKVYENSNHTKVTAVKVRWNNNGFELLVPSRRFDLLKVKSKPPVVITGSENDRNLSIELTPAESLHFGGRMVQRGSQDKPHFSFDTTFVPDFQQSTRRPSTLLSPSSRISYSSKKIRADLDGLSSPGSAAHDTSNEAFIGRVSNSDGAIFNIEKYIHEGAFGIVFMGHHDGQLDKKYAIKQLKNFRMLNSKQQQEARKEAKILKTIKHRNIIGCVDEFVYNQMFYVVFEFANHGDLNQLIKNQKGARFTTLEVAQWFTEIVSGIAFLHQNKIMHRDLKPANIVICRASGSTELQMKVADLGLAKEIDADGSSASAISRAGTPLYMSPEMHDRKKYSYYNDVWALGCVLFELCTLKRVFPELGDVFRPAPTILHTCKLEISGETHDAREWKELSEVSETILVVTPEERPRSRNLLSTMLQIRMQTSKQTVHKITQKATFSTGFTKI